MDAQAVVMVQVDEPEWTRAVVQSACQLAQRKHARLVLVKLVPVKHALYLGTAMGYLTLDEAQEQVVQGYVALAAEAGVPCDVQFYQYYDLMRAISEATACSGATIVFARLPESKLWFWREARVEVLRQHLAHLDATLYDSAVEMEP
jgi:hypothetical protein